ncbi:unnamed protein product [Alopecurus aequalis]
MEPDWSSLPSELIGHIADCLLATNDVDCYMDFRAVCSSWRSAAEDPNSNPSDIRFHPRRWILVDEVFQSDARLMVNTATGRVVRKDRRYEVTATTPCGFVVLADLEPPHAASVLNPLTGHMIRFKVSVPFDMGISAAALSGGSSPDLFLLSDRCYEYYRANPDSSGFNLNEDEFLFLLLRLPVGGGTCANGGKGVVTPLPIDFPCKVSPVLERCAIDPSKLFSYHTSGRFADLPGTGHTNHCFVVESSGEPLVVVMQQSRMKVFYMDTEGDELEPVKSIGHRAIFVGYRRCLSVSADIPSVAANCVYYVKSTDSTLDIYKYDIEDGKDERVCEAIDSLNNATFSFASPLFTVVQPLSSYTTNARESQLAIERREQLELHYREYSEYHDYMIEILSSMNEVSSS